MAEIRFYADEQIARAVIHGVRERGIDILSTPEARMLGASDEDHLALANRLGRVLVTQDRDFIRLHATGFAHSGIMFAKPHFSIGEIVSKLVLFHATVDAQEMHSRLEFL